MALAEYVFKKFGRRSRPIFNPLTDKVHTTVTQLLQNNPDRLAIIVINLSPNTVWIAFDRNVSSSHGILLTPNGGSAMFIADEDLELVGYPLFAVASADNSDVYVVEVEAE